MNITETGLNRKRAFWFLLITAFLSTMVAMFTNGVVNADIVNAYLIFCGSIMSIIMGAKTVDNSFKTNIEKEKLRNKENGEDE